MDPIVFALAGLIAILLLGALAAAFGAESRESFGDDHHADWRTPAAGGAR